VESTIKSKYIYWNKYINIRKSPKDTFVMTFEDGKDTVLFSSKIKENFMINDTAAEIIGLVNGTKTYEDIISVLSVKYDEDKGSIKNKVERFILKMSDLYGVGVEGQEIPEERSVLIVEEKSIYPIVASIELTNKCNLKCLHCYGDFGNDNKTEMSLDNSKKLLYDLKKLGVRIIELTGGEITVYPHLKEVLLYAVDLKFEQIALLTNGIALQDDIIDIVEKNKSNILVQIDFHSMSDDYLTWFTKVSNTLGKIKDNIMRLAKKEVRMRIAATITRKNMNEIEEIADWVYNLGIHSIGFTLAMNMGRAEKSDNDIFITDPKEMKKIEEAIRKVSLKKENFISIINTDRLKQKNCGCTTSHVVITSEGFIKICTMDNLNYCNSNLGNVFKTNIKDIYDNEWEYINAFYSTEAPRPEFEECTKCENLGFCFHCMIRGIVKATQLGEDCKWYQSRVPQIVKDKLKIGFN